MTEELIKRTEKAIVLLEDLVSKTQVLIEKVEHLLEPQIITEDISIYIGAEVLELYDDFQNKEQPIKQSIYGYKIDFKSQEKSIVDIRTIHGPVHQGLWLALRASLDVLRFRLISDKSIVIYHSHPWVEDLALHNKTHPNMTFDTELVKIVQDLLSYFLDTKMTFIEHISANQGLRKLYYELANCIEKTTKERK